MVLVYQSSVEDALMLKASYRALREYRSHYFRRPLQNTVIIKGQVMNSFCVVIVQREGKGEIVVTPPDRLDRFCISWPDRCRRRASGGGGMDTGDMEQRGDISTAQCLGPAAACSALVLVVGHNGNGESALLLSLRLGIRRMLSMFHNVMAEEVLTAHDPINDVRKSNDGSISPSSSSSCSSHVGCISLA
jgi:hypothetical protein